MNIRQTTLGMYDESDIISLSYGMHVKDNILFDRAVGAKHIIAEKLIPTLNKLKNQVLLKDWLEKSELSSEELAELLFFLDSIAALNVKRKNINKILVIIYKLKLLLLVQRFINNSIRLPANFVNLLKVLLIQSKLFSFAFLVNLLLFLFLGFHLTSLIYFSVLFFSVLFISSIAHEYVHIYFSRLSNDNAVIIARGFRMGIMGKTNELNTLLSSVLGPLAGITLSVLAYIIINIISVNNFYLLPLVCASVHLASLLPFYGDGEIVYKTGIKFIRRKLYAQTT